MIDRLAPAERAKLMARVKGKDTNPERMVRSLIHRMGYRFRLHRKDLPGRPDIVLPRHKKIIFVHGCFWHQHSGCARSKRPASRPEFWNAKLDRNVERDKEVQTALRQRGWDILIIWECDLKIRENLIKMLRKFMAKE